MIVREGERNSMPPNVEQIFVALIGAGLTLCGGLMLIRPELLRKISPEEDVTPKDNRIGGLALIVFGVCMLLAVFHYGVRPCAPGECTDF
jgi:hypothetical protein